VTSQEPVIGKGKSTALTLFLFSLQKAVRMLKKSLKTNKLSSAARSSRRKKLLNFKVY
jgi:hypothetical protein